MTQIDHPKNVLEINININSVLAPPNVETFVAL